MSPNIFGCIWYNLNVTILILYLCNIDQVNKLIKAAEVFKEEVSYKKAMRLENLYPNAMVQNPHYTIFDVGLFSPRAGQDIFVSLCFGAQLVIIQGHEPQNRIFWADHIPKWRLDHLCEWDVGTPSTIWFSRNITGSIWDYSWIPFYWKIMGTHLLLHGASLHRIHTESRIVQSNSLPIHPDMLLYGSQNLRFKKDEPPKNP